MNRLAAFWFNPAPAARLGMLRILVGLYALGYLTTRYAVILEMTEAATFFSPVGLLRIFTDATGVDGAPPLGLVYLLIGACLLANIAFVIGYKHRLTGPAFGLLALVTLSLWNSFGMDLHSHNLLALHVLILGFSAAADAYARDAARGPRRRPPDEGNPRSRRFYKRALASSRAAAGGDESGWRYGWPIRLMCSVTVASYVLAGIAKIRGPLGWGWMDGDVVRRLAAVDGLQRVVLGADSGGLISHLAFPITSLFTVIGTLALVVELGAPLFFVNRQAARVWVFAAMSMHWGMFAIMGIAYPYQLCGIGLASFFAVEDLPDALRRYWSLLASRAAQLEEADRKPRRQTRIATVSIIALALTLFAGLRERPPQVPPTVANKKEVSLKDLPARIDAAGSYLIKQGQANGRFTYAINLDREVESGPYSVIRHAGAIVTLAKLYDAKGFGKAGAKEAAIAAGAPEPGEDIVRRVLKASSYLMEHYVRLPRISDAVQKSVNVTNTLAVFSHPAEENLGTDQPVAQLGGSALGLVALAEARKMDAAFIPLSQLQAIGRFLMFMQRPDGGFHGRFREDILFEESGEPLYGNGEAILAFVRLYTHDLDPAWLQAAARAVRNILDARKGMKSLPPDVWLMLGGRELLQFYDKIPEPVFTREELRAHMEGIVTSVLEVQATFIGNGIFSGTFEPGGQSTPTAMSIEMLAVLHEILADAPAKKDLRDRVQVAMIDGMRFLVRCQVSKGPGHGGFVRAVTKIPDASKAFNEAQSEIRIDYMQHAISAMIDFKSTICPLSDVCD